MSIVKDWDMIEKNPLPPDVAGLPTMVAEPWLQVNEAMPIACTEGTTCDREGNLYYCFRKGPSSTIYRISPEKEITEIYHHPDGHMIGLAIHKDGRYFVCCAQGKLLVLDKDGNFERDLLARYPEYKLAPNDLVFDMKGNLYFTDFSGPVGNPTGGVYRFDAEGDYYALHKIAGGMGCANGIVLNPQGTELWVAETSFNRVTRIRLDAEGFLRPRAAIAYVYYSQGVGNLDSSKMDSEGNLYQTVNFDGRILVINKYGVPVANVVVPDREKGDCMFSPNLMIRPGTDEGYLISSGMRGAWLFKFKTLAKAQTVFSDL